MDPLVNNSGQTQSPSDSDPMNAITWDWFSIVQLIMALFGITGNILIITVYLKKLRNRSNSNKLIVMLAVADLLTSIAIIPLPSLAVVPMSAAGRVYCLFTYSAVIMWISIVASIFTLTLLSLERYFAIVRPIKHKIIFSNHRIKCFIAMIWVGAVIINCVHFFITRVSDNNECELVWYSPGLQAFHGMLVFMIEFVIPVAVMVVSHYCAIKELKNQAKSLLERNESTSSPAFSLLRCRRRVIRMVLMVVIIFIICWSPDQIAYLILNFGGLSADYFRSTTYRCLAVLAFINSCANPIIYICLNKNFRVASAQLFPCVKWKVGSASDERSTSRWPDSIHGTNRDLPLTENCSNLA